VLEILIDCNALVGAIEDCAKIKSVFLNSVKVKYAVVLLLSKKVLLT
jgi:hypothetical protein